jgi:hypothetical protein
MKTLNDVIQSIKGELETLSGIEKILGDLKIDVNNLRDEASRQPALYAYWSERAALAEYLFYTADLNLKKVESELYEEYSTVLRSKGERVTERSIEASIYRDERYIRAKEEVVKWKTISMIVNGVADALRSRANMIWTLGKMIQDEVDVLKYMDKT